MEKYNLEFEIWMGIQVHSASSLLPTPTATLFIFSFSWSIKPFVTKQYESLRKVFNTNASKSIWQYSVGC